MTIDKGTSIGVNFDAYNVSGGYNYSNVSDDKLNQAMQGILNVKQLNK